MASVFIATLLALLVDLKLYMANSGTRKEKYLTVYIKKHETEPGSEWTSGSKAISQLPKRKKTLSESAPADGTQTRQDTISGNSTEPPTDSKPVRDWNSIAKKIAEQTVADEFRQETARASLWRQSGSVMFQPASKVIINEEEPVLPDIRFKRRVHVFGLGITIGSCFFGIPLVGVPVEKRSTGITLVVCADDSE